MDNIENPPVQENVEETPERPTYTSGLKPKRKSPIWILMILALILIIGGIFFLVKKSSNKEVEASPTPESMGYETTQPEVTLEPTPSPAAVDKKNIKIQISNGTGITGEASFLQGKLKTLGYTNIAIGNADNEDYETTEVTFSSSMVKEIVDEITKELKSIYTNVNTKTGSAGSYDIKIITGLKKGATVKPSSTATSTPTPKASSTTTPTPSPTATP